jgi:hypothetical protein
MTSRLDRLNARRSDDSVPQAKLLNEAYRHIVQSDSVKYVIGAMQPIDPDYTKNTYVQGDRVKNQLEHRLEFKCEYEYQGSVTNDTHIKAKSDIDLLVIISKFFSLEAPQVPQSPYQGDPVQDLLALRAQAEEALEVAFPEADVDKTGNKSIAIEGGSLTRKIDVVPANWYNTNKFSEHSSAMYRGVHVLDKSVPSRLANTPFLHNAWIDHKDDKVAGGLRKASRLMKSLKYDSENIDLSSYDIVSIAFNMPDASLTQPKGAELLLLDSCLDYCKQLSQNDALRDSIKVPDQHRLIFCDGHATLAGLNQLVAELEKLTSDVLLENQRSFKRLAEARVEY